MPRRPRNEEPGAIHHAIAKGNAGETIVRDDHDRNTLVGRMRAVIVLHDWSCLAYCLLDTHLHLVVRTTEPNLGAGMKSLLGPYAQNFNLRHDRDGSLFRPRFYSTRIESDDHLISAIVYVLLNPVAAGAVAEPGSWPWSSYGATLGGETSSQEVDVRATLELFGADAEVARRAISAGMHIARTRNRHP